MKLKESVFFMKEKKIHNKAVIHKPRPPPEDPGNERRRQRSKEWEPEEDQTNGGKKGETHREGG